MNRLSTRKAGLVVCLGLMAAAILLMALPLGVPLTFAPGPDIRTRKTFAFFDLSVWGMSGNVFPFLTAVLSVVVFFLLLFHYFRMLCTAVSREKDWQSRLFQIAFGSGVCGFMVQAMTDYSFYNYRVMFLFWAYLALGALAARRSQLPEGRLLV